MRVCTCCPLIAAAALLLPAPTAPCDDLFGAKPWGIWTYGAPLDSERRGTPMYVDDETLRILGDAGVYFVYGLKQTHLGDGLVEKLSRCKTHGIEVHVSVTPTAEDIEFVNIWSFEALRNEIDEVLKFLRAADLVGDPVTTLVYDMEFLIGKTFPFYGLDWRIIRQLRRYDEIEAMFLEFNRHVREEYGLDIQICSDISQAMDPNDGDDDLVRLFGLLADPRASMGYMVYRRDVFARDYIRRHCDVLNPGDTAILNAWKTEDHFCWGDIDCAIADARLVLSHRAPEVQLEIWALWYFLKSYGVDGLRAFIEAVTSDPATWPPLDVLVEGLPGRPVSRSATGYAAFAKRGSAQHRKPIGLRGRPVSRSATATYEEQRPTAADQWFFFVRALDFVAPLFRLPLGYLSGAGCLAGDSGTLPAAPQPRQVAPH